MKTLEYHRLDTHRVTAQYQKVKQFIEQDDFFSADVKKLSPTPYYRAKLNSRDRLLFMIVRYHNQPYALLLEVIHQHAYDKSKFLNGARVDETKVIDSVAVDSLEPITYLNEQRPNFHILNKIISFDDHQETIFHVPPPLIIIGPAGSGKTALTLEKMKNCTGDVLYVTHSPYLVQHAQELYDTEHHHDEDERRIDFFSYNEFMETLKVPDQREASFRDFRQWLSQQPPSPFTRNAHKLYEEFHGVLSGTSVNNPYLAQEAYLNLGIKQSIYPAEERQSVYALYEKYLQFLKATALYDVNILSYDYASLAQPTYDALIIDEIQDFTNVQLALLLRTLRSPDNFILCGDSNQIVHPNFFSWANIKSLFYHSTTTPHHHADLMRVLHTNYRSAQSIVQLANRLLKIKNVRLGSIDKESHYLMKSHSSEDHAINFLHASDHHIQTLNQKTKQSTKYAVLVIRDELKSKAAQQFDTPLIFSIHEAKGLEYEYIILYDFISSEEKAFLSIAEGVSHEAIAENLVYRRAKDKTDRSLAIYQFYINALYVAVTRATRGIYWLESRKHHPFFNLLDLGNSPEILNIQDQQTSSVEEWQREARKLELQGKQEQADAIKSSLAPDQTVPWEVLTQDKVAALIQRIFSGHTSKPSQMLLLEYAVLHHYNALLRPLMSLGVKAAKNPKKCLNLIQRKYYPTYTSNNIKHAMKQVADYGIDFRNVFNQTLLMIATQLGNFRLATTLIDIGANTNLTDNVGRTAFTLLLESMIQKNAPSTAAALYELLRPTHLSVQVDSKLIKIHPHKMEYFLFYFALTFLKLLPRLRGEPREGHSYIVSAAAIEPILQLLPETMLPPYRRRRPYISSILSKNEATRDHPYNHKLFKRLSRGCYTINPELKIKVQDQWVKPLPTDEQNMPAIRLPAGIETT